MKKVIFITLLVAAFSTLSFAQGGISGKLMGLHPGDNGYTEEPLIAAHVYVLFGKSKLGTITDMEGNFTIKPLEPGVYNITVIHSSLDTIIIEQVYVSSTETTYLPTQKIPMQKTLTTLVIKGEPENTMKTEIPTQTDIKRSDLNTLSSNGSIADIITAMGPGATMVGNSNEVTFRGARVGDALYLVDGVPQRSMSTNVPNRAIGNIKTIYGGVPSRYGDFMGGVIVVETRSYFEWLNEQHINELRIADSMKKEE